MGWVGRTRSSPGHTHLDEVVGDVLRFEAAHSLGRRLCHVHPGVIQLQLAEIGEEVSRFFKERCGMTRQHLQTKVSLVLCFFPKTKAAHNPSLTSKPMGNKPPLRAALCATTSLFLVKTFYSHGKRPAQTDREKNPIHALNYFLKKRLTFAPPDCRRRLNPASLV